jgi:hypothetical protein
LRGPEDRLDERRVARVGDEIATPIGRQTRARRSRSSARRLSAPDRIFCSLGCAAETPRQDHRALAHRCNRKRPQTASFRPRTSSTASAQ